ncbi:hypothetical protein D3C85_1658520 [compost metagenome]
MPRGLLCCALQFYFHGINALGKGIHPCPRIVQLGKERLHSHGVEPIFEEEHHTQFRPCTAAMYTSTVGRQGRNTATGLRLQATDGPKCRDR